MRDRHSLPHLLLVARDPHLANLALHRLSHQGFDVTWAPDAASGCDLLRHGAYDVVVVEAPADLEAIPLPQADAAHPRPATVTLFPPSDRFDDAHAPAAESRRLDELPELIFSAMTRQQIEESPELSQDGLEFHAEVLRALMDQTHQGMLVFDPQHRLIMWNEGAFKVCPCLDQGASHYGTPYSALCMPPEGVHEAEPLLKEEILDLATRGHVVYTHRCNNGQRLRVLSRPLAQGGFILLLKILPDPGPHGYPAQGTFMAR